MKVFVFYNYSDKYFDTLPKFMSQSGQTVYRSVKDFDNFLAHYFEPSRYSHFSAFDSSKKLLFIHEV